MSDGFVMRVNDFVKEKLGSATCHSCANMPDVNAVSWMGNEQTKMSYPLWNANDADATFINSGGKPFGIPDGTRWVNVCIQNDEFCITSDGFSI